MKTLIKNATIVNEGLVSYGSLLINDELIEAILGVEDDLSAIKYDEVIDAKGLWLIPGVIDDQVHFREPGLTHKGTIYTESKAAVAGGITSFMEMPNTFPQTTTIDLLEQKYKIAASTSLANYSFYLGATNTNLDEIVKINPRNVCGVKVFMGSSTGNMLVNDFDTLNNIFAESPTLIATHCEDEQIINSNLIYFQSIYGKSLGVEFHPMIRSEEACFSSSSLSVELAHKYNSRLHVLHISTAKELSLFSNEKLLKEKKITAEACVHHLWFSDVDYKKYGNRIKWNPAIKKEEDRRSLVDGLNVDLIDVVATDHAPHLLEEKNGFCYVAASGGPLVQHSLLAMIQLHKKGYFKIEKIVEKMCHSPADLFRIEKRGYLRKGYYADLVLIDINAPQQVEAKNCYSKCGWSPFEGIQFDARIKKTFVNGKIVYDNGIFNEEQKGKRLLFNV